MTTRPLPDLAAALTRLADPGAPGVPDAELLRRFAEHRDEAAFELLVWRHGGMVLGTCRRVLGRSPDADDAFQAAFLALARKPGSVRRAEALAGWLHRVALRAALRLRAGRRAAEPLPEVAAPAEPLPDDTAAVLDEEIGRLPDKLRAAFVLCELEGRTDAEAAEQLGCPKGTVLSRLSRARERLRARLTRRGLAGAAAGALAVGAPPALAATQVAHTVRAAVAFAAGRPAGAVAPAQSALAHGVLRELTADALKPVAAALLVVILAGAAVGAVLATRGPGAAHAPTGAFAPVPPATPANRLAPAPPAPAPNFKLATADKGVVEVDEVRFSPDGKWLVTAGGKPNGDTVDAAVAVWDAATGKHVHTFTEPDGVGAAVAFSPDSKLFATANPGDGTVSLWATGTWKEEAKLKHPMANDIGFSPDGKLVVTRSKAFAGKTAFSEVKVWSADTGKRAFDHLPLVDETFASAAFSPDSKWLVVGVSTGTVRLIDTATGKLKRELEVREKADNQAEFSPDGKSVLTWTTGFEVVAGEASGGVRLWSTETGKLERKFEPNDAPVVGARFTTDGKHIVALSTSGGLVWVWETATGKRVANIPVATAQFAELTWLAISPGGELLAVSSWEGRQKARERQVTALFDLPGGKERLRLPDARAVVFNHDGTVAALITEKDKTVEVTVRGVAELLKQK